MNYENKAHECLAKALMEERGLGGWIIGELLGQVKALQELSARGPVSLWGGLLWWMRSIATGARLGLAQKANFIGMNRVGQRTP